jgi:hypothetical protein
MQLEIWLVTEIFLRYKSEHVVSSMTEVIKMGQQNPTMYKHEMPYTVLDVY